jgi:hypothetical protein
LLRLLHTYEVRAADGAASKILWSFQSLLLSLLVEDFHHRHTNDADDVEWGIDADLAVTNLAVAVVAGKHRSIVFFQGLPNNFC